MDGMFMISVNRTDCTRNDLFFSSSFEAISYYTPRGVAVAIIMVIKRNARHNLCFAESTSDPAVSASHAAPSNTAV